MKRRFLFPFYCMLFLSLWSCQLVEVAKKDAKSTYGYFFRGKKIRGRTLKQDLYTTLYSLGIDKEIFPKVNDPNSRYIKVDKSGREILTRTGRPVKNLGAKEKKYSIYIHRAARKHGVDPALIFAVIRAESGFNPRAKSAVGAQGLMQLMPSTAKSLGVRNTFNPEENINGGAYYLKLLSKEFNNRNLVLAAYNAGPGNVKKYNNRIPPFTETKNYVKRVNKYYKYYKGKGV